jgi:hypothetical protein
MKTEDRVVGPILLMATLCNVFFISRFAEWGLKVLFKTRFIFVALLFIVFGLYTYKSIKRSVFIAEQRVAHEKVLSTYNQVLSDKIVVATLIGKTFPFLNPFENYHFRYGKNFIRLSGWLSVYPENHKLVRKLSGGEDLEHLFDYLKKSSEQAVLLCNSDEIELLQKYMMFCYQQTYHFKLVKNMENIGGLNVYEVY